MSAFDGETSAQNTGGDLRKGFVYERVPHVTLKSIANNEEIDEIHAKYQVETGQTAGRDQQTGKTKMGGMGSPTAMNSTFEVRIYCDVITGILGISA